MVTVSTWLFVVLVVEMGLASPFQTLWGVALAGCIVFLLQSFICEAL
jgi:hypothetical protein